MYPRLHPFPVPPSAHPPKLSSRPAPRTGLAPSDCRPNLGVHMGLVVHWGAGWVVRVRLVLALVVAGGCPPVHHHWGRSASGKSGQT